MLKEYEPRRSRYMQTDKQSGVEFYGNDVEKIINNKGQETATVPGVLNVIKSALSETEVPVDSDLRLDTPDEIKSVLSELISTQKKVNGVYDFLMGFLESKTTLLRQPGEAELKSSVFIMIRNLQRKLENTIAGLDMLLHLNGQTAFDSLKEAQRPPRFPSVWKAIGVVMTAAFLGGAVDAVAGADNKLPDVTQTQTMNDQSQEEVRVLTNSIDRNILASLNLIQAKLADKGISPANKGIDGGGRPISPADDGKIVDSTSKSSELSPNLQSSETFLPANFTLFDLPKGGLVGSDRRPVIDQFLTHAQDALPGSKARAYGSDYYEIVLNDNADFGSYGPDFDKQMADAKAYVKDLNTRAGDTVSRVAVYYAADQFTIAIKIVQEVNLISTNNGQETTTNMKPNSLVMHLDDGSQRLFPVAKEGDFIAPIAAIDLVSAEQTAGLIKPGQKTLALTDSVVVTIDELLDPQKRIIATIAQPEVGNPAKDMIVSVAPVGKPLEGAQAAPATAVPTDVPNTAFPELTLTETPVDFKLEVQQYTNQRALSPEELSVIGATTGLETLLTDENGANHTFRISVIGMEGATDLQVTGSINDALKDVGLDLKNMPANSIKDIKIVMSKSGVEMKKKAEEMGLTVRTGQTLLIGAGVPVMEFAYGKGPNGEDEVVIFASSRFIENGWSNNTDSVGKVIPFETRYGQFISTAILAALKLETMPNSAAQVSPDKQIYSVVKGLNSKDPNVDFDFLDIIAPEPAAK